MACQRKSKGAGMYVFVPNPNNNVAKKRCKEQNCKAKEQKHSYGIKNINNKNNILGILRRYGTGLASV
jgi:hypothetical protein